LKRGMMGGLDVVIGGGSDGNGAGDGPLLVLLHGFGAPAEDLVPLAYHLELPAGTRFVCPGAPLSLGMPFSDARAWWMIDFARLERGRYTQEVPPGLPESHARVVALLDECATTLGAAPERTVLGGFSQGSMLSIDVALRTTRPLAGLLLMSTSLIAEPEWAPRFATRRGLKVFQSHGTLDPILPYGIAERLRLLWEEAGADVTFVSFEGGHEIPPPVVAEAERFLAAALGG
jgi:phospholipase/carboxylesterase